MSSTHEPAIWSQNTDHTGQQIPCFDKCQLTITWMSNIGEGRYKPWLYVPVNLLAGVWPPSCASPPPPSCERAHQQFRYEKINSWVSFSFLYEYGAPLSRPSGRRSSAINLRDNNCEQCLVYCFISFSPRVHGTWYQLVNNNSMFIERGVYIVYQLFVSSRVIECFGSRASLTVLEKQCCIWSIYDVSFFTV